MKTKIYLLFIAALCAAILSTTVSVTQAAGFREKGPAYIDRKGPNALMFDAHGFKRFVDRYMEVTSRTRFYDENGEPISFIDLKIPCRAQILYRKTNSGAVPEAISVKVEYYRDNEPVDTKWNLPVMKPDLPH
jgi:hypothetical protein